MLGSKVRYSSEVSLSTDCMQLASRILRGDFRLDTDKTLNCFFAGWSLGGFSALQIARIIADRPDIKFSVAGILLIETPFQYARSKYTEVSEPVVEDFPELTQKSFENCDTMLREWDLPKWDGPALGGKTVIVKTGGRRFDLELGKLICKPLNEDWKTIDYELYKHETEAAPENPKAPPPAVLIRGIQKTTNQGDSGHSSLVDMYRDEQLIGWEGRHPDFIKAVIEFDSHHYNVFDKYDDAKVSDSLPSIFSGLAKINTNDKIPVRQTKAITNNVKECLEVLDSLQPPKPKPKQMPLMDFF